MEYGIKKFASMVVIEYSKVNCIDPDFIRCVADYMNDERSKEIFKCINRLIEKYKDITNKISIEEFEDKLYISSKREYMEQLLSRCLKLSEGDVTFFEFLLVCVYICRFTECVYVNYKCWKILKLTAGCLEAVYCRKYWNYFEENNGFRGLADFCRSLNNGPTLVKYENEECIFPHVVDIDRNAKVKNLGNLNYVDNVISLNPMEEKLIKDSTYFLSSRHDQRPDFLVKCWSYSEVAQDKEIEGWEVVSEKTNKTGIRCEHCESKCGQYPKDLFNELKK